MATEYNPTEFMDGPDSTKPEFTFPAAGSEARKDFWDHVQTCDLVPGEDTTRRLLKLCMMLEERIAAIERSIKGNSPKL